MHFKTKVKSGSEKKLNHETKSSVEKWKWKIVALKTEYIIESESIVEKWKW